MTGLSSGTLVFTSVDVGFVLPGVKFVKHFRWIRATASGHVCSVQVASGDVVFESEADGAKFIDVHPLYKFVNGLTIATLDSGKLFVYLA
jgi:hypothetical protein